MSIVSIAETASTNADLLAQASSAREGDWLRADRQTAGRGRMGRAWQSPSGNLYASTIVRLRPGDSAPATLALVAAVALSDTLREAAPSLAFAIKWPNDILVDRAKIAGILLERGGDTVVIGFGVNLAWHPEDLRRPVTSLAALGYAVDVGGFCASLAAAFALRVDDWRTDLAIIASAWEAAAHPIGTPLRVATGDGASIEGCYEGLAPDGALRLRLADGSFRAIHAGDVFLV